MIWTHPRYGFGKGRSQIQSTTPGQILARCKRPANPRCFLTKLAEDLAGDQLAIHGDHAFDAVLDHERNRCAVPGVNPRRGARIARESRQVQREDVNGLR